MSYRNKKAVERLNSKDQAHFAAKAQDFFSKGMSNTEDLAGIGSIIQGPGGQHASMDTT